MYCHSASLSEANPLQPSILRHRGLSGPTVSVVFAYKRFVEFRGRRNIKGLPFRLVEAFGSRPNMSSDVSTKAPSVLGEGLCLGKMFTPSCHPACST